MKLTFEKVSKSYNKHIVLSDINYEFQEGKMYCLLGVNGAGKSTFLNMIMQLTPINSGAVFYDRKNYKALPVSIKQRIGFLSEDLNLVDELSLYQYLGFIGKLYNIDKHILKVRISDLINLFFQDETDFKNKRMVSFSTGMKKKAALIASIMHLPDLLILDEPFSNLDPLSAHRVAELLKSYLKGDRIIIFSSHNLNFVEKLAPEILIINESKIAFSSSFQNFTNKGKERIDDALFRSLSINPENNSLPWI